MTTDQTDLYAVLGVPPSATPAELGHAYRSQLRRHHPDTRPSDRDSRYAESDATLQRILAAYALLRDPIRRAAYDRAVAGARSAPTLAPAPQTVRVVRRHPPPVPPIVAGPARWQPP